MEFIRSLPILLVAAAVLWLVLRPKYVFAVRIREGEPRVARGRVPRAFVADVADVCRLENLQHGIVRGVLRGRALVLAFSRDIPPPVQQQLRNAWRLRAPR